MSAVKWLGRRHVISKQVINLYYVVCCSMYFNTYNTIHFNHDHIKRPFFRGFFCLKFNKKYSIKSEGRVFGGDIKPLRVLYRRTIN